LDEERNVTSRERLKVEAYEANLELYRAGLVLGTFGNASAFSPELGVLAIKPSGVPYEDLRPKNMVLVGLDGKTVGSSLRPSSDTKTHLALYRAFSDVRGVAHTHATHSTSWAQARREIPCFGTTHADYFNGPIPCTKPLSSKQVRGDYELETGLAIVRCVGKRDPRLLQMILVAGHGPFTWGESAEKAVHNAIVLEELAKTALLTLLIAPEASPLNKATLEKHFERKRGKKSYYGQK
jgi:L-ribulose-5-phosphate 4-epimerase